MSNNTILDKKRELQRQKEEILKYESDIWATADTLRGLAIKQSQYPDYMMPFFALRLIESRMLRAVDEIDKENELSVADLREELMQEKDEAKKVEIRKKLDEAIDTLADYYETENLPGNDLIIRQNITLAELCKTDKNFETEFYKYLSAFDDETKMLLGFESDNEKYLDLAKYLQELKSKQSLYTYASKWAKIDFKSYDNSAVTTLEEHIKRKWADLSADTAGEQYTPDDVIKLISEIAISKVNINEDGVHIYDPTCGGGNLLFGVEDTILDLNENALVSTYGQELNSTLFALSKIESKFRKESCVRLGNTLTETKCEKENGFEIVVANPPYGNDWKMFQKDVIADLTGQYVDYPSTTDGQLLFDQHILYHLAENGVAIIVNNGSPFFSGDAGSGESNIRKSFMDCDCVEAIVQLPQDEFFNTNISTYLWILNKSKAPERKDKILLINASELFVMLKKSKGMKRREVSAEQRRMIVDALAKFQDSDISKVLDKDEFYFNKYHITLLNGDVNGLALKDRNENGDEILYSNKFNLKSIKIGGNEIPASICDFDKDRYTSVEDLFRKEYLAICNNPYQADTLFETGDCKIEYDSAIDSWKIDGVTVGKADVYVDALYKKPTKKLPARIEFALIVKTSVYQKDYEIIPYSRNEESNNSNIADFLSKYVTRPFIFTKNIIGTEINFNKIFYKPEDLRSMEEILADVADIDKEIKELENNFAL